MNSAFLPIFETMLSVNPEKINLDSLDFPSEKLERTVCIDFYFPKDSTNPSFDVMLINDGQDLRTMKFGNILQDLYKADAIRPLLCIGIHAGLQRKLEYGTANTADFKGRGNRARLYMQFIIEELIPAIHKLFPEKTMSSWAFAGFSLGGLSALDITWTHHKLFKMAAVFSGSLWWRTLGMEDPDYQDELHRIMHNQIRDGEFVPGLKFFFECGTEDETEDRNGNGIIDSIDDTLDLINQLVSK